MYNGRRGKKKKKERLLVKENWKAREDKGPNAGLLNVVVKLKRVE